MILSMIKLMIVLSMKNLNPFDTILAFLWLVQLEALLWKGSTRGYNHGGGFEASSSFHVKYGSMGKVQFLFFKMLLLVLKKLSFWEENWTQSYNSMKLWDFPDIFWSLKLFGNSCGNSYIPCVLLIIRPCFTWGKENFVKHQKVSKYYNHDCRFLNLYR